MNVGLSVAQKKIISHTKRLHCNDVFKLFGWPESREAKDNKISEAFHQAIEASGGSDFELSQKILSNVSIISMHMHIYTNEFHKLHHVSSNIRSQLKNIANEVVPTIYKLTPDEATSVAMEPDACIRYVKEKVLYWRTHMCCFHNGSVQKSDGQVCVQIYPVVFY